MDTSPVCLCTHYFLIRSASTQKHYCAYIVLLLGPLAFGQFTPSPTYPTVHYLPTFSSIVYLVLPPTPFLVH